MINAASLATVPLSRFHSIDTQQTRVEIAAPFLYLSGDTDVRDAFCDFVLQPPLVVSASTSLDAARRWARQARARLLIVVDALETFLGVVTVADLFSGKSLRSEEGAAGRATVADVLTPKSRLWGIPLAALAVATMADLGKTLNASTESHLLVADTERHVIRGLISRADIAQRLPSPQPRAHQMPAPERWC